MGRASRGTPHTRSRVRRTIAVAMTAAAIVTAAAGCSDHLRAAGDDAHEAVEALGGTARDALDALVSPQPDDVLAPTTVAAAELGISSTLGRAVLDLTGVDLTGVEAGSPIVVPVRMHAAGDVEVTVPAGIGVQADVLVRAGSIEWQFDGEGVTVRGIGRRRFLENEPAVTSGAHILLDIAATLGTVTISEAPR